jgi:hypothetical protein
MRLQPKSWWNILDQLTGVEGRRGWKYNSKWRRESTREAQVDQEYDKRRDYRPETTAAVLFDE